MIVLAGAAFGMVQLYLFLQQRQARTAVARESAPTPRVVVQQVKLGDIEQRVQLTGTVQPLAEVHVVPEVAGRLERLRVDGGKLIEEGDPVEKGQVVAVLEHEKLQAAVERARAALAVANASREVALVGVADAEREKERILKLYENKGPVTEQQRDRVLTAHQAALAQLRLAEASIEQAKAALRQAELTLEDATIEAPASGVVTRKFAEEGDMVGPAGPILKISCIDTVEVTAGLAERYMASVRPGQTQTAVVVDAFPDRTFAGKVYRLGVELDPVTRLAEVVVRIENPGHELKPGMFARVNVLLQRKQNVLLVPQAALLRGSDRAHVFVVEGDVARKRTVQTGLSSGDSLEVLSGLEHGQAVVVGGKELLQDGIKVEVVAQP